MGMFSFGFPDLLFVLDFGFDVAVILTGNQVTGDRCQYRESRRVTVFHCTTEPDKGKPQHFYICTKFTIGNQISRALSLNMGPEEGEIVEESSTQPGDWFTLGNKQNGVSKMHTEIETGKPPRRESKSHIVDNEDGISDRCGKSSLITTPEPQTVVESVSVASAKPESSSSCVHPDPASELVQDESRMKCSSIDDEIAVVQGASYPQIKQQYSKEVTTLEEDRSPPVFEARIPEAVLSAQTCPSSPPEEKILEPEIAEQNEEPKNEAPSLPVNVSMSDQKSSISDVENSVEAASLPMQDDLEAERKKAALKLAMEGNPAFIYEKIYMTGTKKEQQSYRCFKCPTAVDRLERLEYHYLNHGANFKFRCSKCDFSHNLQMVLIRHEERHAMQKRLAPKQENSSPVSSSSNRVSDPPTEKTTTERLKSGSGEDIVLNQTEDVLEIDVPVSSLNEASNLVVQAEPSISSHTVSLASQTSPTKFHRKRKRTCFVSRSQRKRYKVGNVQPELSTCENGDESTATASSETNNVWIRRKFGAAQSISDEEYVKLRTGNPKLIYPYRYGSVNRKSAPVNTFKCFKCPSPYISFTDYVRHAGLHGANFKYQCRVCDYSCPDRPHMTQHCSLHRLQGNIPEEDLTIPPENGKPDSVSSTTDGKAAGENDDISEPGNDEQFIIEYDMDDDDIISDSEILDFAPSRKRMHSDNVSGKAGEALRSRSAANRNNKLTERAVVVVERLTPTNLTMSSSIPRPRPRSQPSQDAAFYSLNLKLHGESKFNPENYLLSKLKGKNFMPFTDVDMVLRHAAIEFVSNQADGKTASIIAALVAIGYDVLVEGYTPTAFCGWELRDLIKRGNDTAQLEITLSLKCFPELQDKYGSHLRLQRTLIRGIPLSSCTFLVSSADQSGHHFVPPKSITMSSLRGMLREMNVLPQFYRIILLDRENMKYMSKHTETWYELFEEAKNCRIRRIKSNLTGMQLVMSRLDEDIQWRSDRLESLKSQLESDYPVEKNPIFRNWREMDIESHIVAERELTEFEAKRNELNAILSEYTGEIKEISATLLRKMNEILSRFLQSHNCAGGIVVDEYKKTMGLWMRESNSAGSTAEPPTVSEAHAAWLTMNVGRKTTAVFGLYLSFWRIIESCPFFAVDSFSSSDLEFRFPKAGLSILQDLIKMKSGQQFFMSLPESEA